MCDTERHQEVIAHHDSTRLPDSELHLPWNRSGGHLPERRGPGEGGRGIRLRPCLRHGPLLSASRHRHARRADVRVLLDLVCARTAHGAGAALCAGHGKQLPEPGAAREDDHHTRPRLQRSRDPGIGCGWFEKEHEDLGFEFGTFTDRFEKLEEALQIIGPMLRGEQPTLEGKHYRVAEAINSPPPISRIPIMIGGQGEKKTLRMVAQYADESNLVGDNAAIPRKLEVLAEHCDRVGRDRAEITVTKLQMVAVAPTQEELDADFRAMAEAKGLEGFTHRRSEACAHHGRPGHGGSHPRRRREQGAGRPRGRPSHQRTQHGADRAARTDREQDPGLTGELAGERSREPVRLELRARGSSVHRRPSFLLRKRA